MIPTFFASPARLRQLRAAADALVGTPFAANSEAPGADGGIDCVRLLNWLYRTCGALGPLEIPRQHMDHGQHSGHSLLIAAFDTWPALTSRFTRVWRACDPSALQSFSPSVLLPGDALCFRAGLVPHHGGVLLEHGELIHVLRGPGAHVAQLDAVVRRRRLLGYLAAVYRPLPLSDQQSALSDQP
jgi:cell wall-associated NlpC family hydrolase